MATGIEREEGVDSKGKRQGKVQESKEDTGIGLGSSDIVVDIDQNVNGKEKE